MDVHAYDWMWYPSRVGTREQRGGYPRIFRMDNRRDSRRNMIIGLIK